MHHVLDSAKRIVIKIGSTLLVDSMGHIKRQWLKRLIDDIAELTQRGKQIILVSSGAVAIGKHHFHKTQKQSIEWAQAAAAIGQIQLSNAYQEIMAEHQIDVAQILLTLDDSENRKRYLNARNTLSTLLAHRIIPIINENDSVATSEIRYGDNDRLAARVAQMCDAELLILLSDIDGLYDADPNLNPEAKFIPEVTQLNESIIAMGGESASSYGSGGMKTKLDAAQIATSSGCAMLITRGTIAHPLAALGQNKKHTLFKARQTPMKARKNWLKQHLKPEGKLFIDEGAHKALKQGRSLLAIGVVAVEGQFNKGDAVDIFNHHQQLVARGLINYPAREISLIAGLHSQDILKTLHYSGTDEVIHRNDLVVLD